MTIGGGSADYQGEPMTVSSTLRGDVVLGFREKQYILKVDDVGFALYERLNEDGKPE
jgi:hypothetical protein